jgi:hypothetical protein
MRSVYFASDEPQVKGDKRVPAGFLRPMRGAIVAAGLLLTTLGAASFAAERSRFELTLEVLVNVQVSSVSRRVELVSQAAASIFLKALWRH